MRFPRRKIPPQPTFDRTREAELAESHQKAKQTLERTAESLRRVRLLEAEVGLIARGAAPSS